MTTPTKYDDIIDTRDLIERFEELEAERDERNGDDWTPGEDNPWAAENPDDDVELEAIAAFLDELKGNGGDEQWRGDWYPVTCIRDSYFENYAQELADDIGAIDSSANWPNNCIDWERATRELQQDYTCADFDDITYWFR